MTTVFVLQHTHIHAHGEEDSKLIGVYASRSAAEAAVGRLRDRPGFRDFPRILESSDPEDSGFTIDEYPLDADHWREGFVTL